MITYSYTETGQIWKFKVKLWVDTLTEHLLSRLLAFTAANTRVFRVSPAMGIDSCWMYDESCTKDKVLRHLPNHYSCFSLHGSLCNEEETLVSKNVNLHCRAVDSACWWKYRCCPSLRLRLLTFRREAKTRLSKQFCVSHNIYAMLVLQSVPTRKE